jgi:hypothetical protein
MAAPQHLGFPRKETRSMRAPLLIAALVGLAGCANGPTPEELAAADVATCAEYGMPVGHPDHGECRLILDQIRVQQAQAEAAQRASMAAALGAYSQYMQAIAPPQPVAPAPAYPTGGGLCGPTNPWCR